MDSFHLLLAEIPFQVRIRGGNAERIEARFGHFAQSADSTELDPIVLDLEVDPHRHLPQPEQIAWPGCYGTRGEQGSIQFTRLGLDLVYDPSSRHARGVALPTNERLAPVIDPTPLDTPLRLLLSYELPRAGGLLLHSSGYGDSRGALLFIGPSGSGKTTTARKLPPDSVLSDDMVAVRQTGGIWHAYALPFVGEYGQRTLPRKTRLRRIFALERGAAMRERTLPTLQALARVMACVPTFVLGDPENARLLDLGLDLVRDIPTSELALALEAPLEALLEEVLGA